MCEFIPIILRCGAQGQDVVFGVVDHVEPTPGQPVTLYDARMVLERSVVCGGLFGLAARGPIGSKTKITAPVAKAIETVWQEWLLVSPEAKIAFDEWEPFFG